MLLEIIILPIPTLDTIVASGIVGPLTKSPTKISGLVVAIPTIFVSLFKYVAIVVALIIHC